jgi:hypothetical protein
MERTIKKWLCCVGAILIILKIKVASIKIANELIPIRVFEI